MKFDYEQYPSLKNIKGLPKIYYLSKPIREAVLQAVPKLEHLIGEINSIERTLLQEAPKAATYSFLNENGKISFKMLFHSSEKFIEGTIDKDGVYEYLVKSPNPNVNSLTENEKENINTSFFSCLYIELFLQFAEIETKELKAGNKIWKEINCLYNNRTNINVTIIDSTWFTNLIKSDAFKVRGHFRLQPCGESRNERKLIWISEFQKEGYFRKAKKLNDN